MSDGDPSEADASTVVAVVDPRPLVRDRLRSVIDALEGVRVVAVHADWSEVPAPVDEAVVWVGPTPAPSTAARQVSLEDVSVDDPAAVLALLRAAVALDLPAPDRDPTPRPLSPLEDDVLGGIARGRSAAEIAVDLGVSTKSVENARRRVMEKLAAGTQVEAVSRAHALRTAGIDLTGGRPR
jgi:DNA-binding NarL/FixJ family response regulator